MILYEGEHYNVAYNGILLEGIYLGKVQKSHRILLNISPDSKEIPIHFPVISIKNIKMTDNKIILNGLQRKINTTPEEQVYLNSIGKKHWGQNL